MRTHDDDGLLGDGDFVMLVCWLLLLLFLFLSLLLAGEMWCSSSDGDL